MSGKRWHDPMKSKISWLGPGMLLAVILLVIAGICYLVISYPKVIVAEEGVVTVTSIIGATPAGYFQDPTWTLTFAEQNGVYKVASDLTNIAEGDRFTLVRRRDGTLAIDPLPR